MQLISPLRRLQAQTFPNANSQTGKLHLPHQNQQCGFDVHQDLECPKPVSHSLIMSYLLSCGRGSFVKYGEEKGDSGSLWINESQRFSVEPPLASLGSAKHMDIYWIRLDMVWFSEIFFGLILNKIFEKYEYQIWWERWYFQNVLYGWLYDYILWNNPPSVWFAEKN